MKTLSKQAYIRPYVEIYEPSQVDVLSASNFNAKDVTGNDHDWDLTGLNGGGN